MGCGSSKSVSIESSLQKEMRLVLIGKTGSGKSATGNTILGFKAFKSELAANAETRICSQNCAYNRFNKKIVVVDTPGVFDTEKSNEEIQDEIIKCIALTSPGPHAFIMVLNVSTRYTDEDNRTVKHFEKYFGKQLYRYLIVLFTRKDQLEINNKTLEEFIQNSPDEMQNLIEKCGGRIFALNNMLHGSKQYKEVEKLIKLISTNVASNGNTCYTDKIYKLVEEEIQKEEMKILEQIRLREEEELRQIEMKVREENKGILDEERKELEEKFKKEKEQVRDEIRKSLEKSTFQKFVDGLSSLASVIGTLIRKFFGLI